MPRVETKTFFPSLSKQDVETMRGWFSHPVKRYRFLRFLRERLVFALEAQSKEQQGTSDKAALARVYKKLKAVKSK